MGDKKATPASGDGNYDGNYNDDHTDVTELSEQDAEATEIVENPSEAAQAAELKAALEKTRNDLLYLGAEFENYKRHAIKERSELLRYGAERLARDLLEVVDNFERALSVEETAENQNTFREGVSMIHKELHSLLSRHGVQELNPVGQPFDPSLHEALTDEESDSVPEGHISRVFKKAYRLHDRLLRPAQVVVAKPRSRPSGE